MIDSLLVFIWAFLVSVFSIPSIVYVSHVKKLLDEPNVRTVHEQLTPRLGGLAIFAGFMSSITIFGKILFGIQQLLAGCLILFFIGIKDDIISVSAFKKFFVQVLASGIVLFIGDIRITNFQGFLGLYELDLGISYAFSFLVIIGVTNSINLIDGIDGLAGSIVTLIALTFGFVFLFSGQQSLAPFALVAFSLAGSVIGFLRYNFNRAIIFMGDTGSLVCGFILAFLALKMVESGAVDVAPAFSIATLYIPLADTLRIFTVRILTGASPFSPDKNHIHHGLLRHGLSNHTVIFLLLSLNIVAILFVVHFSFLGNTILLSILGGTIILGALLLDLKKPKVLREG